MAEKEYNFEILFNGLEDAKRQINYNNDDFENLLDISEEVKVLKEYYESVLEPEVQVFTRSY